MARFDVYNYLMKNPGYDPGFKSWYDTAGWNNWPNGVSEADAGRILDAYGGNWDRSKGRNPGDDYQGSIQQMYDWLALKTGGQPTSDFGKYHYGAYGNIGSGSSPGGVSYDTWASAVDNKAPGGGGVTRTVPPDPTLPGAGGKTGGNYTMPTPPRYTGGGTPWQDWLNQVQNWQAPDEATLQADPAYNTPQARALAVVNDMLNKTGGSRMLSPYYINNLRARASSGDIGARQALSTANAGVPLTEGPGVGDFLKNFVSGAQGGLGGTTADTKAQVGQLLGNLNQGRDTFERGQGGASADLWNTLRESPDLAARMMELALTGPFAGIMKNKMYQGGISAPVAAYGDPMMDWLAYILKDIPGNVLPWQARPGTAD